MSIDRHRAVPDVSLLPLASVVGAAPIGYLLESPDHRQAINRIQWTVRALDALDPGSFLMVELPPGRDAADLRSLGVRIARRPGREPGDRLPDAWLVAAGKATVGKQADGPAMAVTGVDSPDHLTWAESHGADLLAGSLVGDPIHLAPLDLAGLTG